MITEAPYPYITVITSRHNLVFSEADAGYCTAMPKQGGCAPALFTVPHLKVNMIGTNQRGTQGSSTNFDRTIVASADKPKFIACHCPHALDVPKQGPRGLARLNVPHLDSIVQAA